MARGKQRKQEGLGGNNGGGRVTFVGCVVWLSVYVALYCWLLLLGIACSLCLKVIDEDWLVMIGERHFVLFARMVCLFCLNFIY